MKIFEIVKENLECDKINKALKARRLVPTASSVNQSGVTTGLYARVTVILIEY
jgi:hypothetical protein